MEVLKGFGIFVVKFNMETNVLLSTDPKGDHS